MTAVWISDLELETTLPTNQPANIPPHCIRRCSTLVSAFAICSCLFEDNNPADRESEANQAFVFRAGSRVEGMGAEVSAAASSSKPSRRQVTRPPEFRRRKSARLFLASGVFVFVPFSFAVNNCGRLSSSRCLLVNTKTLTTGKNT